MLMSVCNLCFTLFISGNKKVIFFFFNSKLCNQKANSKDYFMQMFHWNRQAGNYAFLESWDQCLHGQLGSVSSYGPVGESQ